MVLRQESTATILCTKCGEKTAHYHYEMRGSPLRPLGLDGAMLCPKCFNRLRALLISEGFTVKEMRGKEKP